MNNSFDTKLKNLSGKFIKENKLTGTYVAEGHPETIFLWALGLGNFLIIEKDDIAVSQANWDYEHFTRFEGTVELKN